METFRPGILISAFIGFVLVEKCVGNNELISDTIINKKLAIFLLIFWEGIYEVIAETKNMGTNNGFFYFVESAMQTGICISENNCRHMQALCLGNLVEKVPM